MRVAGREYRAVDVCDGAVRWIDQRLLPHRFEQVVSRDPEDVARAIETMAVRGAPSIGAAAAFGLALAWRVDRARFVEHWLPRFRATRPTAVNLFHACDAMESLARRLPSEAGMMERAQAWAEDEIAANRRMGEHLAERLACGQRRILTHCNAGWLATVDRGTDRDIGV